MQDLIVVFQPHARVFTRVKGAVWALDVVTRAGSGVLTTPVTFPVTSVTSVQTNAGVEWASRICPRRLYILYRTSHAHFHRPTSRSERKLETLGIGQGHIEAMSRGKGVVSAVGTQNSTVTVHNSAVAAVWIDQQMGLNGCDTSTHAVIRQHAIHRRPTRLA